MNSAGASDRSPGPGCASLSALARRYCALGAIMRAGCELQLRVDHARSALEWQTGRAIKDWNDDPARTHAEVIAAFDAAIVAVTACIA
jgi:hypothetical protein